MKRDWRILLLAGLSIPLGALIACTPASAPPQPVYCHDWTSAEKRDHYRDDLALAPNNSLHGVIKDYERLCANLKP